MSSQELLTASHVILDSLNEGAVEVHDAREKLLGTEGLVRILRKVGYPERGLQIGAVEKQLLLHSNAIRLTDDLTLIEVRF